jgi:hypothetical protein
VSGIAFKPEEATEALKEYVGQIVATDYSEEPFGFKGAPDIKRKGKVLGIKIRTEEYEKEQFELEPDRPLAFGTTDKMSEDEVIWQSYVIGCLEFAIDGEGSISITRAKRQSKRGYRYVPRVAIVNTVMAFLEKLKLVCGGGKITKRAASTWSDKPLFTYEMNRPQMKGWLPKLSLAIKEEQKKLLLDFLALIEGKQGGHSDEEWYELDSYYEKMRLLNSGIPVVVEYWSRNKWYPPSKVKKTKWIYFIEALNQVGAMKDVSIAGTNDDERMQSFARSLLGMTFKWEERECESMVKVRGGGVKKFDVSLPVEYLGKKPIEAPAEVKQAIIGEPAGKPAGGID